MKLLILTEHEQDALAGALGREIDSDGEESLRCISYSIRLSSFGSEEDEYESDEATDDAYAYARSAATLAGILARI